MNEIDTFHKRLITNKNTRRKIVLLELISAEQRTFKIQEIALNLNVSERTILSDLNELKVISNDNFLNVEKGTCSVLPKSERVLVDVEKKLIATEPLYHILLAYYNNEIFSIFEWSNILYISEGTLERYLNNLKLLLNEYNLRLKYSPVCIIGPEVNIRLFLFHFLSGTSIFDYHDSTSAPEIYASIIKHIQAKTPLYPTVQSNIILYWIIIEKKRLQGKNYVSLPESLIKIKNDEGNIIYFKEIWKLMHIECPPDQIEAELAFMMIIHNNAGYYNAYTIFPFVSDIIEDVEMFFFELVRLFPLNYSLRHDMYHAYKSYFFNISQLTLLSPLFQKNNPELNSFTKKNFKSTYRQVKLLFDSYQSKFNFSKLIYSEDVCVNLTLMISSFMDNIPKKIGVYIEGNMNFVLLMQEKFKSFAFKSVEYYFFSYEHINNENLSLLNVDIFITNNSKIFCYVKETTVVETILVSEIPTKSDWCKIISLCIDSKF